MLYRGSAGVTVNRQKEELIMLFAFTIRNTVFQEVRSSGHSTGKIGALPLLLVAVAPT